MKRLLFVDDEPNVLQALHRMSGASGRMTMEFAEGGQARSPCPAALRRGADRHANARRDGAELLETSSDSIPAPCIVLPSAIGNPS